MSTAFERRRPPALLMESEHLLRTDVRASLATPQSTAWDAKREHGQLHVLLNSAAYATDTLWAILDDKKVSLDKFHASAVVFGNSTRSNSSETTSRNAESIVQTDMRRDNGGSAILLAVSAQAWCPSRLRATPP